jgi:hypothetical protein
MRRALVAVLALVSIGRSPAVAQTCMGLAPFSNAPIQVTGTGQFGEISNTFGATAGYGVPSGLYGAVGVATTSLDGVDGHQLGLAARAGYQLTLGAAGRTQVCPNASFGLGMGPNDDGAGVDRSARAASIGVTVGTVLGASPRMKVVPTAGLSFAYARQQAENAAGSVLFEISDRYALAQVGVGIILNSTVSILPNVEIPFGLEGIDPVFGLSLGYNFGR